MNRPRPFARITAALTVSACVVIAFALLACEPAPTPTPTATPSPTPTPIATSTPTLVETSTPTPTPDDPPTEFVLDLLTTVFGYRQDGTAEVELSVELRNNGNSPAKDTPTVTVECQLNGQSVDGCGGHAGRPRPA